jgi:hypothetical protein
MGKNNNNEKLMNYTHREKSKKKIWQNKKQKKSYKKDTKQNSISQSIQMGKIRNRARNKPKSISRKRKINKTSLSKFKITKHNNCHPKEDIQNKNLNKNSY